MTNEPAYGFLDESPALSDSVLFFCVNIISTSDRTNKQLQKIIKKARKRIVKKKIRSLSEIKFHDSEEKIRLYVLREIAKQDVKIIAIAVDKEGRKVNDTPQNYGAVVGIAIAEFLSFYPALNITLDKKFTKDEQVAEFLRVAQNTVQLLSPLNTSVVFNPPVDSKSESLIQLADFVAGALQTKYNQRDGHYFEVIATKIVRVKVIKWTELKKRIVKP